MRGLALAVLAALVLAAPAARAERPPKIQRPRTTRPVVVHQLLGHPAATLAVRGRAARFANVEVVAPCALRDCVAEATADRHGRWRATLPVVLARDVTQLSLTARYPDLRGAAGSVMLDLAPAPVAPAPAAGPQLALIGDSLAQGTAGPLAQLLPGWQVSADARRSRPLGEGMALFESTPLPDRPLVLAFSLFTNDDPVAVAALEAAVRRSVDRLPRGGCVLWATIVRPKVGGVSYGAANARLRALAQDPALAGRLRIVDWARAVDGHRRAWLAKDKVHGTSAGYVERARLYARAAQRCLSR